MKEIQEREGKENSTKWVKIRNSRSERLSYPRNIPQ
jgi:hypothetical protein